MKIKSLILASASLLFIDSILASTNAITNATTAVMASTTNNVEAVSRYKNLFGKDVKTIGVVSVSSILQRKLLDSGIAKLKAAGYKVKVSPNVYGPTRAPVEVRAKAFEEAWLDPEIDVLVFSRGGQGAVDAIQVIDWEKLKARNDMRVIGFSDVTFVVNTMLTKGVGHPLSGPMISALGYNTFTDASISWYRKTFDGSELPRKNLKVVKAPQETISGLGMAGLLERFVRLEEMGLLPDMTGRIVFIESLESHKHIAYEKLQFLVKKGVFDKASAVVFGDFRVKEGVQKTLSEFAANVKCPVFSGFRYGHVKGNLAIDFQRKYFITTKGVMTSPACK